MISIILNAYDTNKAQRHSTIACIAAITKFTDIDYELIIVDNEPKYPIRDDYKVFRVSKLMELIPKTTVYQSYNIGAEKAKGKYLFFIQNDVFVHEKTLDKLVKYFKDFDVVFPQQHNISRADAINISETSDGVLTNIGWRDAGLLGITRKAFEKTGGWDGRFRNLLGEKAFFYRIDKAGLSWTDRTNAFITHVMAGNNLQKDEKLYSEEMIYDAKLIKEYE